MCLVKNMNEPVRMITSRVDGCRVFEEVLEKGIGTSKMKSLGSAAFTISGVNLEVGGNGGNGISD